MTTYNIPGKAGSYRLHPDGRVEVVRTDGGEPHQAKDAPPAVAPEDSFLYRFADAVSKRLIEIQQRIIALEKQLKTERKGFYYRGVFTEGESYEEGDFATHGGGLWACLEPTTTRPGTSEHWQLAVEAGRPGRDARAG